MTSHADRPTQTQIQIVNKDIAKIQLEIVSGTKVTFDCCIDRDGMALLTEDKKVWNEIKSLNIKAIRVRFVTTVNERNISLCRQIMKCGEVFHNDRARGNFQIADGNNYLCYVTEKGGVSQKEASLYTKNKSFVSIQQSLFENLCDKTIPARDKIKEIERGVRNYFTETIYEPTEIRKIVNNQFLSAKDEILLLFPTANSFYRAKYNGVLDLLRKVPIDVTIKVLTQLTNHIQRHEIQQELKSRGKIQVQYIAKPLQKKIMTVVVDQATSIAIEIKDDSKKTFEEGSGTAIYSNS